MLPERAAFAAFPRLELAAGQELARFLRLAGLVVKRAKLDAQIIALSHELGSPRQFAEAFRGRFAETFPELVALVEEPRIGGICLESFVVGRSRFCRLTADVEPADAKIAPDDGEIWVEPGAALP